ncbi:hypothetical protein V2I01_25845 [Micromonospora sp. BRA006-A]|nr:hypothetical protein [Micromonospora sp. BRA006-A]
MAHVVAAKAVAFRIAGEPRFQDQQRRALTGAKIVADRLGAAEVAKTGIRVVSGGTDVHLVLVDLSHADLDGAQASGCRKASASPSTVMPCRSTPARRW